MLLDNGVVMLCPLLLFGARVNRTIARRMEEIGTAMFLDMNQQLLKEVRKSSWAETKVPSFKDKAHVRCTRSEWPPV